MSIRENFISTEYFWGNSHVSFNYKIVWSDWNLYLHYIERKVYFLKTFHKERSVVQKICNRRLCDSLQATSHLGWINYGHSSWCLLSSWPNSRPVGHLHSAQHCRCRLLRTTLRACSQKYRIFTPRVQQVSTNDFRPFHDEKLSKL